MPISLGQSHRFTILVPVKMLIPNLLTCLNLLLGTLAIILLFQGESQWVLLCAGLCLILDSLDGMLARVLDAQSAMGEQLDSLADLVAFGVLPACVLCYLYNEWCSSELAPVSILALLIAVASAIRLARFNLDQRERQVFYGLPTPAAAMFIFGLLLMQWCDHKLIANISCNTPLFIALVVLLPTLLLSNLRLWGLKGLKEPNGKIILLVLLLISIVVVALLKSAALSAFVIIYVLFGLLNTFLKVY